MLLPSIAYFAFTSKVMMAIADREDGCNVVPTSTVFDASNLQEKSLKSGYALAPYSAYEARDPYEKSRARCTSNTEGITMLQKDAGLSKTHLQIIDQADVTVLRSKSFVHDIGTASESEGSDVLLYFLCIFVLWICIPYCNSLRASVHSKASAFASSSHSGSYVVIKWIIVISAFIVAHNFLWWLLHTALVHKPSVPYFSANLRDLHVFSVDGNSTTLATNESHPLCNATESCDDSSDAKTRCALGGSTVAALSGAIAGGVVCLPLGALGFAQCGGAGLLTGAITGMKHGVQSKCPEDAVRNGVLPRKVEGFIGRAVDWCKYWAVYWHEKSLANFEKQKPRGWKQLQ